MRHQALQCKSNLGCLVWASNVTTRRITFGSFSRHYTCDSAAWPYCSSWQPFKASWITFLNIRANSRHLCKWCLCVVVHYDLEKEKDPASDHLICTTHSILDSMQLIGLSPDLNPVSNGRHSTYCACWHPHSALPPAGYPDPVASQLSLLHLAKALCSCYASAPTVGVNTVCRIYSLHQRPSSKCCECLFFCLTTLWTCVLCWTSLLSYLWEKLTGK